MKIAKSIKVYGRVQGVYFRASTRQKAQELGVYGFVQNEADQTVYIEAEGEAPAVEQLLEWCHEGPQFARVERVEASDIEVQGFDSFEIRRK